MWRKGDEVHIATDEARGGETNTGMRYVLGIGLALAIVALSAIWITGALHAPQGSRTDPVSNQATPSD